MVINITDTSKYKARWIMLFVAIIFVLFALIVKAKGFFFWLAVFLMTLITLACSFWVISVVLRRIKSRGKIGKIVFSILFIWAICDALISAYNIP